MKTIQQLTAGLCSLLITTQAMAQDSLPKKENPLAISGYVEAYYQYDFNKPADHSRPGFIYSHNRHNEFNLNLGFLKASYNMDRARANLAFAAGTYVNANYSAEPGVLKNIYEANAGIRLSKQKQLWLDAGIFGSHIGFESAASKDCWTLTRSLLAENSPYYEAGAKLTYSTGNSKWLFSLLALNGWQRIQKVNGNSMMSWGSQLQYKPTANVLLNYSTFIGTDKPDSSRQLRVFHNLYGIITLSDKLGLTVGFDIGTEEKNGGGVNTWYSPVGILRYSFSDKWAVAARGEYYCDKNGVIISTTTTNGFRVAGYSLNLDYAPVVNLLARIELRQLQGRDQVFMKEENTTRSNSFITGSLAVSF